MKLLSFLLVEGVWDQREGWLLAGSLLRPFSKTASCWCRWQKILTSLSTIWCLPRHSTGNLFVFGSPDWHLQKPIRGGFWIDRDQVPDILYMAPDEKDCLRDLGVRVSTDLTFATQRDTTVETSSRMSWWALRTFRRRGRYLMLTVL